LFRNRCKISKV